MGIDNSYEMIKVAKEKIKKKKLRISLFIIMMLKD